MATSPASDVDPSDESDQDRSAAATPAAGRPRRVRPGGRRDRLRSHPATRHPYRIAVLLAGTVCIAAGLAASVLPGPLTIPPVLLGLWILSWEFRWAESLFDTFQEKGHEAWEKAKAKPVASGLITAFGLIAAGVAIWAFVHFEVADKARELVGL